MFFTDEEIESRCQIWVSASAVVECLKPHYAFESQVHSRVISWASASLLSSKCRRMVITGKHARERNDCLISPEFWEQFEDSRAREAEDWVSGDFTLSRWDRYDEERKVKLFKVVFCEADLVTLLPHPLAITQQALPSVIKSTSSPLIPSTTPPAPMDMRENKGGRPSKLFWEDALIEMARRLFEGDLKPDKQADIERAMHDWLAANNYSAGDTQVRQRARKLFKVLSK